MKLFKIFMKFVFMMAVVSAATNLYSYTVSADKFFAAGSEGNAGPYLVRSTCGEIAVSEEIQSTNYSSNIGLYRPNVDLSGVKQIKIEQPKFVFKNDLVSVKYLSNNLKVKYSIGSDQHIVLDVYNAIGRKVHTLINASQARGRYTKSVTIALSSGIYFIRMQTENYNECKKLLIIK